MTAVMVLPAAKAAGVSAVDSESTETATLVASMRRFKREVWNIRLSPAVGYAGVKLVKTRSFVVRRVQSLCELTGANSMAFRHLHQWPLHVNPHLRHAHRSQKRH
jgi:hypothetical protein